MNHLPASELQAVEPVVPDFLRLEGGKVIAGNDAPAQRGELRPAQETAELRLANQKNLQERLVPVLKVREHAQLLEGRRPKPLSLVDKQKRSAAFARGIAQIDLESVVD